MKPSRSYLLLLLASALFGSHAQAEAPLHRYEIRGDVVVYDTRTKLSWQRATAPGVFMTLAAAKIYCSALNLNGTGFRVPTLREQATIVDFGRANPSVDPGAFPDTLNEMYWSATVTRNTHDEPSNPPSYWGTFFDVGSTRTITISADSPPTVGVHLRCVR